MGEASVKEIGLGVMGHYRRRGAKKTEALPFISGASRVPSPASYSPFRNQPIPLASHRDAGYWLHVISY